MITAFAVLVGSTIGFIVVIIIGIFLYACLILTNILEPLTEVVARKKVRFF